MNRGRKISGGKYHPNRKKRKFERVGKNILAKLGKLKTKSVRARSGKSKSFILFADVCNLIIKGKAKKVKIKNVLETPSNKFLARQNVLTKGAIIETEEGKARITNRPGQEGCVQAVLLPNQEDKEKRK